MATQRDHFSSRALRRLADLIYRTPRLFFYPQVVLALVCLLYTVRHLQFNTDRNALIGADQQHHAQFLEFLREFPVEDDMVVVVESENQEKNRQFVERLGLRLSADPRLFQDVFFKGTLSLMGPKALLFVPEEELAEMRQTLRDYRPFLEEFTRATNLVSLFDAVNRQFRTAPREPGAAHEPLIKAIPALERILRQATDTLRRPGAPVSPGVTALFGGGDEAEERLYLTFDHGRIYLVTARATSRQVQTEAVERLRTLVAEVQNEVPGVNAGLTGEPVLEWDEMRQSQKDSTKASVIALVLVALVFIYAYRETGRPLKATATLVVGLIYTMAFTTLVVGHLNILTLTFAPILIGLAIDLAIHLVTRYEEELRHGLQQRTALRKALVHTGRGVFTGALTTAAAFLAMIATDFEGVREMGIICGGGLLLTLIPMFTLLPVLLLRGRQNRMDRAGKTSDRRERLERLWLQRPALVLGASFGLALLGILQLPQVRQFDYNLLNLQSKGLASVVYEHKLIDSATKSVLFGAVIADSLEQAQELERKLSALPSVASVESMARYLGENQERKLRLVRQIRDEVQSLQIPRPDTGPVSIAELSQSLYALQGYSGLAADQAEAEDARLAQQLRSLQRAILDFRRDMQRHAESAPWKLARFQQALFEDVRQTFSAIQNQDASSPLRPEDLPESLRNRFVGKSGRLLLQVFPRENVWEREAQERFVYDLLRTAPHATGTPVQLYHYTTLLKSSFEKAAWYALGAVVLMIGLHFRSVSAPVLCLIPVGIGMLWLFAFMGLFGVRFNPANIMTFPLVIGIGITNGVHILNRFLEEQNPAILARSTGKAVVVSGLTTIIGFGSLTLAEHQGISSLGFVMAMGVAACMMAAITTLPATLNLLHKRGWTIKRPSGNNAQSPLGQEEPR